MNDQQGHSTRSQCRSPEGYITAQEVSLRYGIHFETARRRINEANVPSFLGADRRYRFYRIDDIARVFAPTMVIKASEETT